MSSAEHWLSQRVADAPERLRTRMLAALAAADGQQVYHRLADAARSCLASALRDQHSRESALDLLAADALLTHACEAAAEAGVLADFTAQWTPERFAQMLPTRST